MKHIRIWIATMAIVVMSILGTAVVEAQVKEAVTDSVTATTPDLAAESVGDSAATELIAEDEGFNMSLEDLQNTMEPSRSMAL